MIRGTSRLLGFLLLAAGFVALVMDGARSLAGSHLEYARLADTAAALFGERFLALQPFVERSLHPALWNPVLLNALQGPTSLLVLALGLLFHWLGRERRVGIGHLTAN